MSVARTAYIVFCIAIAPFGLSIAIFFIELSFIQLMKRTYDEWRI